MILTQPGETIYRLGRFIRTVVVVQVFIMAMQVGGAEWDMCRIVFRIARRLTASALMEFAVVRVGSLRSLF